MAKPFRAARPLADLVEGALAPACRKRGFATSTVILYWADIVDEATARCTQPEQLIWPRRGANPNADPEPATLVVRVEPGAALMLQYSAPQILERINSVFGWRAVGRLKLLQRPLVPRPQAPPPPTPPSPEAIAWARSQIGESIDHEHLSEALIRLAARIRVGTGQSRPGR